MTILNANLEVTVDYLSVRTGASIYAPRLGFLEKGMRIVPLETKAGYGSIAGWVKIQIDIPPTVSVPNRPPQPLAFPVTTSVYGWASLDYMEQVTPPSPVSNKMKLGVNVITGDGGPMNRALEAGCTAISGINMFGQLSAAAAQRPDVIFMARRYVSSMPAPDPGTLYEGAGSPFLWYLTPLNECDVICNGSPEQIKERAAFDKALFEKMKAMGRKYAGGGFSVGTADYTNPDVCEAMRQHYAPLYNAGMGFNAHFYTPIRGRKMDQWYEGRWNFLFEKCGFNPDPSLAGIFCDECGLDQGGLGGFAAAGASPAEVEAWCRDFLAYSQSGPYAGLFRAAVIFQAGNTSTGPGGWAGYNVDSPDMLAAIGRAAQAGIGPKPIYPQAVKAERQTSSLRSMQTTEENPVSLDAPKKVMAQWS